MTRQQQQVREALARAHGFRSAQETFASLRSGGTRIGLTTVYRALQSLVDAGEADVLRSDSGEALYRLCSDDHHHHLVCRGCGRTVEVADRAVERWAEGIAAEHGFSAVEHTVEVFGTCPSCA